MIRIYLKGNHKRGSEVIVGAIIRVPSFKIILPL